MHANTHVPQSLIDELVTTFEQLQPADIARMGAQRTAQDENDTDGSRLTLPNPATA